MPREMGFDYSGMSFQEQKAREARASFSDFWTFPVIRVSYSRRIV